MAISPGPFTMVRYHVPYGDWIMDAESGMVCGLFRTSDENLLLNSLALLEACEAYLATGSDESYDALKAAVAASREEPDGVPCPAPLRRRRSYTLRPAGEKDAAADAEGERAIQPGA